MKITRDFIFQSAKTMQDRTIHIPTGFVDLDNLCLGMRPGELAILAGRPSMGKSALAVDICLNVSKTQPVLYISTEMSSQSLVERMIVNLAKVDSMKVRLNELDSDEKIRLNEACEDLTTRDIHIEDASYMTTDLLDGLWRRAGKPTLIIVDYLQLLHTNSIATGNRNEDTGNICQALREFAKEENVSILCLSQLNRKNEERNDKTPRMSDMRDSGQIEQIADSIMFIHRPSYYEPLEDDNGQAHIILAKNRNGPTGSINAVWIREYSSFMELNEQEKELFKG